MQTKLISAIVALAFIDGLVFMALLNVARTPVAGEFNNTNETIVTASDTNVGTSTYSRVWSWEKDTTRSSLSPSVGTTTDWKSYVSQNLGLKLLYPPGWRVHDVEEIQHAYDNFPDKEMIIDNDAYRYGTFVRVFKEPLPVLLEARTRMYDEPFRGVESRFKIGSITWTQEVIYNKHLTRPEYCGYFTEYKGNTYETPFCGDTVNELHGTEEAAVISRMLSSVQFSY